MLIKFTLENWKSFREPSSLNMIATRERQHGDRLARLKKYRARALPVAAIFGGNASGKSNLFQALAFAKEFVEKGSDIDAKIPVDPYRLNEDCGKRPTKFQFEILIDNTIYEYIFSITRDRVVEEKLVEISSSSERVLFELAGDKYNIEDEEVKGDMFVQFAADGTRNNQLFLTNSVSQRVGAYEKIYRWFKSCLLLVGPDSVYLPHPDFFDPTHRQFTRIKELLPELDTGLEELAIESVPLSKAPLPEQTKLKMIKDLSKSGSMSLLGGQTEKLFLDANGGEILIKEVVPVKRGMDGKPIIFDMRDESDGTRRLIDLLPAILDASEPGSGKVVFIDEIDRSLHTQLLRKLLEIYLDNKGADSRSQLIFTTHDAMIMDQSLLRRDELWVTERDEDGCSALYSFSEFGDLRYDKDIRKSYLQGRLGGAPRLRCVSPLSLKQKD